MSYRNTLSIYLQTALEIHSHTARQTGRTTELLDSLHEGDRVIVPTSNEKVNFERLLRERDLFGKVEVKVITSTNLDEVFAKVQNSSQGLTKFEHTWVEAYFEQQVKNISDSLRKLENTLSGYGEPHRITKRMANDTWEARWEQRKDNIL